MAPPVTAKPQKSNSLAGSSLTVDTVETLANQSLPLPLSALRVGRSGGLGPGPGLDEEIRFGFAAAGALFQASGAVHDGKLTLTVASDLCYVPYSIESPAARQAILEDVSAASTLNGRFSIDATQMVRFEGPVEVQDPVTPVALIAAVTELVLALKPHLARLGRHLEAAQGMRAT